jgi:hypothetical protein
MKLISSIFLLEFVSGMYFYLPPGTKKCVKEEIHKDVVVTGEYTVTESSLHTVHLKVIDSKDHTLYNKEEAKEGKFAFTTDDQDMFEICFTSEKTGAGYAADQKDHEIKIDVKKGVEAKSYDEQVSRYES